MFCFLPIKFLILLKYMYHGLGFVTKVFVYGCGGLFCLTAYFALVFTIIIFTSHRLIEREREREREREIERESKK